MPEPDKYRGGISQSTEHRVPMEELEKGMKELKGFATHSQNNMN